MKQHFKYFLTVFVLLSTTTLFAQKKWTLEECISYALQNNIQIKRSVLQSERLEKDNIQAIANITPTINTYANYNYVDGFDFNQYTAKFEKFAVKSGGAGINGQMDIFQGLRNFNNIRRAKFDLLAAIEGVEELKKNMSINITTQYLQVLLAQENCNLAINRVETSKSQLERVKSQYELGNVASTEFLQIQAQAINEKAQLTAANNSLDAAYLDLAQMLELDTLDGFKINTDNIILTNDTISMSLNQYYDFAHSTMPSVKIAEYRLKSARKRYSMAIGSISPTLILSYQIGTSFSESAIITDAGGNQIAYPQYSFRSQAKDNIQKFVGLQLNIPILNRLTGYTQISRAKIDVLDAKFELQESDKTLLKSVQQAYAAVKAEYDRYESLKEAESSFKEVYEVSKEKFNLGMVNAIDYGIARDNLIRSQGELLHAKYSYLLRLKILDFYRGIPITL
ncbi:MAG: TolC family protein [Bacteroidales bacterium]|nr:TolC family protein [Bacteroidales bacterium]